MRLKKREIPPAKDYSSQGGAFVRFAQYSHILEITSKKERQPCTQKVWLMLVKVPLHKKTPPLHPDGHNGGIFTLLRKHITLGGIKR